MALNFSFGKKGDAEPAVLPLWHPDFRNVERLPDTKVVRTAFFVNTAAIAAAIALLLWVGYREFDLRSLNDQIATAQLQVDNNQRQNAEALRLSKVFADEQRKLTEIAAFQQLPIGPTRFIALLAASQPPEVSIEQVDLLFAATSAASGVQLRAHVAGSPDQASGAASRYVDTLRANADLSAVFETITLTNLNRDTTGGFLSVDISLKFKSDGKETK